MIEEMDALHAEEAEEERMLASVQQDDEQAAVSLSSMSDAKHFAKRRVKTTCRQITL